MKPKRTEKECPDCGTVKHPLDSWIADCIRVWGAWYCFDCLQKNHSDGKTVIDGSEIGLLI